MKRLIAAAAVCGLSLFGFAAVSYGSVSPPEPINGWPVVSGSTVEGSTLSTTNGTWTNNPTSYSYQWQRCFLYMGVTPTCLNISGATSSTYVTQAADVGDEVQTLVTATNAGGSTSFPSLSVGPITSPTAVYGYRCVNIFQPRIVVTVTSYAQLPRFGYRCSYGLLHN